MRISYDFHIHSCLSPCADEEMTPNNIVRLSKLLGLDAIAVCDHNTTGNLPAFEKVALRENICMLFGMEFESAEEVHIICLFDNLEAAMEFGTFVKNRMPKIPLNERIFGKQIIMDDMDREIGREENLLSTASVVTLQDGIKKVYDLGGVAYPAHVDRMSNSIISNLGFIDSSLPFTCVEFSKSCNIAEYLKRNSCLEKYRPIKSSDAHRLEDINLPKNFLDADKASSALVINILKKKL